MTEAGQSSLFSRRQRGIDRDLSPTDIYTKSDEFHAWMIGERMMNPETTTKAKEKELFKQFMEVSEQPFLPIVLAR